MQTLCVFSRGLFSDTHHSHLHVETSTWSYPALTWVPASLFPHSQSWGSKIRLSLRALHHGREANLSLPRMRGSPQRRGGLPCPLHPGVPLSRLVSLVEGPPSQGVLSIHRLPTSFRATCSTQPRPWGHSLAHRSLKVSARAYRGSRLRKQYSMGLRQLLLCARQVVMRKT